MQKLARGLIALGIVVVFVVGIVAFYSDAYAACRMRPQCSTDADCTAICGGAGHCVHSSCPIRICKCG